MERGGEAWQCVERRGEAWRGKVWFTIFDEELPPSALGLNSMEISPELSSGMTSGWCEFKLLCSCSPLPRYGSLIEFELPVPSLQFGGCQYGWLLASWIIS